MKFDGRPHQKSKSYSWRDSQPGDLDTDGKQVDQCTIVIVRIKDCPIIETDRGLRYRTEGVCQAFPLNYGGTSYGYTAPKEVHSKVGKICWHRASSSNVLCHDYYVVKRYQVHDAQVYTCSIYHHLENYTEVGGKLIPARIKP